MRRGAACAALLLRFLCPEPAEAVLFPLPKSLPKAPTLAFRSGARPVPVAPPPPTPWDEVSSVSSADVDRVPPAGEPPGLTAEPAPALREEDDDEAGAKTTEATAARKPPPLLSLERAASLREELARAQTTVLRSLATVLARRSVDDNAPPPEQPEQPFPRSGRWRDRLVETLPSLPNKVLPITVAAPRPADVAFNLAMVLPPASIALVAAAVVSHDLVAPLSAFVPAASVETAFQFARRAQLSYRVRALAAEPLPSPAGVDGRRPGPDGDESFAAFWARVLDATEDLGSFVEGWFVPLDDNDDEPVRYQELRASDVEEWLGRNTFGRAVADLDPTDADHVRAMREELEAKLDHRFRPDDDDDDADAHADASSSSSSNTPTVRYRPLAPAAEDIKVRSFPLLLYSLLAVIRELYALRALPALGFERKQARGFQYWVRRRGGGSASPAAKKTTTTTTSSPGNNATTSLIEEISRLESVEPSSRREEDDDEAPVPAVVYAHGIGYGLQPFGAFIARLVEAVGDDAPVVLLDVGAISTTVAAPTLANGTAFATDFRDALREEGLASCVFVAHSFGSALAAFVAKNRPECVRGLVLIEPIAFLLHFAKCTRRVLYHEREAQRDILLSIFTADQTNALTLRRRLWWHEAVLLADDLVGKLDLPSTVFLADNDKIVPSDQIARHLEPYCRNGGDPAAPNGERARESGRDSEEEEEDAGRHPLEREAARRPASTKRPKRPRRLLPRPRLGRFRRRRAPAHAETTNDSDDPVAVSSKPRPTLPLTVEHFRDAGHSAWRTNPESIARVVDATVAAVRAAKRPKLADVAPSVAETQRLDDDVVFFFEDDVKEDGVESPVPGRRLLPRRRRSDLARRRLRVLARLRRVVRSRDALPTKKDAASSSTPKDHFREIDDRVPA